MTDPPGTLELVLREVASTLDLLGQAVTSPPVPSGLLALLRDADVGADLLGLTTDEMTDLCAELQVATAAASALASGTPDVVALSKALSGVFDLISRLDGGGQHPDLGTAAERLIAHLLTEYLHHRRPALYAFLRAAGLMLEPHSGVAGPPPRLDPRRLPFLLTEPNSLLAQAYGWGGDNLDFPLLLDHLKQLLLAVGFLTLTYDPDEDLQAQLGLTDSGATPALRLALAAMAPADEAAVEVGLLLVPHEPSGRPDGLAIVPYGAGLVSTAIPLGDLWSLIVEASGELDSPYGVVIAPDGPTIGALDGTLRPLKLTARLAIERAVPAGALRTLLGDPLGTRLEVGTLALSFRASADPPDAGVDLDGTDWRIVIRPSARDGFLAAALPVEGLTLSFSMGVGWSHRHGLHFKGSTGLRLELDAATRTGPVEITGLSLALQGAADAGSGQPAAIRLTTATSFVLQLGPFTAAVTGLGLRGELLLGGADRNVGIGQLDLAPQPPTGVGLSISSEAVNGGGFLRFDPAAGRYAGVFELTILKTVSVKAIAIITTKMPDGSEGFALLILITAQGFTPIQLGMGFSLTGIGGLIALNRTVDADAVRGGLRDGILDSVLFVKDPVKNADRVLTTLDKVFPIARDRLVVGPLAEISWGTPAIVHLRLALLLDLPMPIRAVVLAALSVTLPKPEAPVVEIHVDAIGVLDLAKGQLALDASLHDSRILSFTLTGDMALRLDWGAQPGFLLSVGGFHPRFTAPPGLRPLNRLALQLTNSTNPLVRFEAYLAITSNTLQLGARAMVKLEVGGFGVEGGGSFDTLVQWSPFHLEVDVAAWVKITAGGATILSLNLALSVTGPAPWHLTGTAEFHILFISVSVHVDLTLGQSSTAAAAVDAVDVTDLIWQEVSAPASWQAVLPPDAVPGVVIAAAGSDADRVLAHPLAVVSVRQKVAPLGVAVTHVGAHLTKQGPATHNLSVLAADGTNATPVTDLFARAQFTDVPAEQRLSAPSFESFDSGVMLAPAAAASSGPGLSFPAVVDTLDLTSFDIPAALGRPAPAVAGTSTGGGQ